MDITKVEKWGWTVIIHIATKVHTRSEKEWQNNLQREFT